MRTLLGGDRKAFGSRNFAQSCGIEQAGINVLGLQHGISFQNGLPLAPLASMFETMEGVTGAPGSRAWSPSRRLRGDAGEELDGIHRREQYGIHRREQYRVRA
jgi:hypothetical protein